MGEARGSLERRCGQDPVCCDQQEDLAQAFKALGHPARLMILAGLSRSDNHCCGDICSLLPLAQSTVSQHLKVLKSCGLIELESEGPRSRYRVNHERLRWLMEANDRFFKQIYMPAD